MGIVFLKKGGKFGSSGLRTSVCLRRAARRTGGRNSTPSVALAQLEGQEQESSPNLVRVRLATALMNLRGFYIRAPLFPSIRPINAPLQTMPMKTKIPKISEALPAAGEQIAKGTGIRLPLACLPCLFWLAGCHPTKVPPRRHATQGDGRPGNGAENRGVERVYRAHRRSGIRRGPRAGQRLSDQLGLQSGQPREKG